MLSELFRNNIRRTDTIMTKRDQSLEQKKHDMSVRSINFSRYLMIRYFSAAFLFTNLFWLVFAICYQNIVASIISGLLFVLLLIASVEQISKWNVRNTKIYKTVLSTPARCKCNLCYQLLFTVWKDSISFYGYKRCRKCDLYNFSCWNIRIYFDLKKN